MQTLSNIARGVSALETRPCLPVFFPPASYHNLVRQSCNCPVTKANSAVRGLDGKCWYAGFVIAPGRIRSQGEESRQAWGG
jgi:hypothetical protein